MVPLPAYTHITTPAPNPRNGKLRRSSGSPNYDGRTWARERRTGTPQRTADPFQGVIVATVPPASARLTPVRMRTEQATDHRGAWPLDTRIPTDTEPADQFAVGRSTGP